MPYSSCQFKPLTDCLIVDAPTRAPVGRFSAVVLPLKHAPFCPKSLPLLCKDWHPSPSATCLLQPAECGVRPSPLSPPLQLPPTPPLLKTNVLHLLPAATSGLLQPPERPVWLQPLGTQTWLHPPPHNCQRSPNRHGSETYLEAVTGSPLPCRPVFSLLSPACFIDLYTCPSSCELLPSLLPASASFVN